MSAITLQSIQGDAKTLIQAAQAVVGNKLAGLTIATESPTEDLAKTVEPALKSKGACLILRYPAAARRSSDRPGSALLIADLAIDLVTVPEILVDATGLGSTNPLEIVSTLFATIPGKPTTSGPSQFRVAELPFEVLGEEEGGLLYYRSAFEAPLYIHNA